MYRIDLITEPGQVYCYCLTLDRFPTLGGREILMPKPPLIDVEKVMYRDPNGIMQTLSRSAYYVDTESKPGRIILTREAWPRTDGGCGAVVIVYRGGHDGAERPERDPLGGH